MPAHRIFILSPASCGGKRADLLFNDRATFPLALELRSDKGAELGDVFSFLSGLYFRGKIGYASAFARPPRRTPGVMIITSSRGLVRPDTRITIEDLREFAAVPIGIDEPRYARPFQRDTVSLRGTVGDECDVVLLGSIASDKYVSVLGKVFGERLLFPAEFVGRGDMSRGGLLLRCVRDETELTYIPVAGATRRGTRPPKLVPIRAPRSRPGRAG
jgi:hypothetical protein